MRRLTPLEERLNRRLSILNRKLFGFTLIELLIVIAILGIIGSVVTFGVVNGTIKARDGTRKANLAQIANALEQYYTDKGFHYISGNYTSQTGDNWIPNLNPYFRTIPRDPKQAASGVFIADLRSRFLGILKNLEPKPVYAVILVSGTVTGPACVNYGTKYRFTATYEDSAGYSDILYAYILINSTNTYDVTAAPQGAFLAVLNNDIQDFGVKDDSGTWLWSGNGNGNSYADLDRVTTSFSGSGTTLTINWDITFKGAWQSESAQVWTRAADHSAGPTTYGAGQALTIPCPAATPTPTPSPTTPPELPPSGSGYFYAYYSDPVGSYYELWAKLEDPTDPQANTSSTAKCKLSVPNGAPIAFNYCVASHK